MTDLQMLKNMNLWEKIGWVMVNDKQKMKTIFLGIIIFIISITAFFTILKTDEYNRATNYIVQSETRLNRLQENYLNIFTRLDENRKLYKEYDIYNAKYIAERREYKRLVDKLDSIKKDYFNNEMNDVIDAFELIDEETKLSIIERIANLEQTTSPLNADTAEVIEIDKELFALYAKCSKHASDLEKEFKTYTIRNEAIQLKGKNDVVKANGKRLFEQVNDNKYKFVSKMSGLNPYKVEDQGKYTLDELRDIKKNNLELVALLDQSLDSNKAFNHYWDTLQEQYYTIVTKNYYKKSTERIKEDNPEYEEWIEDEEYEDEETYTERVYVGSRIVNDKKEDIYEDVTKTRSVTRTREVTKNNGEPEKITVNYEVYTFYINIEKHTPKGVETTVEKVGEKHEARDNDYKKWDYKEDQKIGYVEWKKLWDDEESIVRGRHITPRLE